MIEFDSNKGRTKAKTRPMSREKKKSMHAAIQIINYNDCNLDNITQTMSGNRRHLLSTKHSEKIPLYKRISGACMSKLDNKSI
mgnify:CR=1 FL=1